MSLITKAKIEFFSDLELIHVFKRQVAVIQRDSVWWLHMVVPKMVELKLDAYLHW